jgi:hypothetical protein
VRAFVLDRQLDLTEGRTFAYPDCATSDEAHLFLRHALAVSHISEHALLRGLATRNLQIASPAELNERGFGLLVPGIVPLLENVTEAVWFAGSEGKRCSWDG